jgi:hypothetical protein
MCRSKPEATKRISGKKQYINSARLCLYSCSSFCYWNTWPLAPILSQMNPVHTPSPCFLKIRFNTLLIFTHRHHKSSQWVKFMWWV